MLNHDQPCNIFSDLEISKRLLITFKNILLTTENMLYYTHLPQRFSTLKHEVAVAIVLALKYGGIKMLECGEILQ